MILKNDLETTVKSILAFNKSDFTTNIPTYLLPYSGATFSRKKKNETISDLNNIKYIKVSLCQLE